MPAARTLLIILFYLSSSLLWASKSFISLNSLKRITFGPTDSFQGILDKKNTLYFTKTKNLTNHIFYQNNKKTESILLNNNAGTRDPEISPKGNKLLLVNLKDDSSGEICIFDLKKQLLNCLESGEYSVANPFWVDKTHIGYLRRKITFPDSKIELTVQNIENHKKQIIYQGKINSPSYDATNSLFAFNFYDKNYHQWNIKFMSFINDINFAVSIPLPGVSGVLRFSQDGRFLYFSQYLNDTNFDQKIDGDDNSVIFRFPIDNIKNNNSKTIFPEQITSVQDNCNFPFPTTKTLLLTCAFAGSLNIYSLPLSGKIPLSWSKKDILNAHSAARTYEDRLLILNILRYRYPNSFPTRNMIEKILGNHLKLEDVTAGIFYINKLLEMEKRPEKKGFLELLKIYLLIDESKKHEPLQRKSVYFRSFINDKIKKIKSYSNKIKLRQILLSYCYNFLDEKKAARKTISTVNLDSKMSYLERYLSLKLIKVLFGNSSNKLIRSYLDVLKRTELSEEAVIFYGFKYLSLLDKLHEKNIKAQAKTINFMLSQEKIAHIRVRQLFDFELLIINLITTNDSKSQRDIFNKIKKVFWQTKDGYFLRKALYIRAIINLSRADNIDFLGKVSSSWLIYTKPNETEYQYAVKQYTTTTFYKAYNALSKKLLKESANLFYLAVRQTDDLEAHHMMTMIRDVDLNDRPTLKKDYANLTKQGIVADSVKYSKALLLSNDAHSDPSTIKTAIETLIDLTAKDLTNPGVSLHLLAYLYHEKLLLNKTALDYDKNLYNNANRNYVLALDLFKDNIRYKASALSNLSRLNSDTRNYSLAITYLQKRGELPFLSLDEKLSYIWQHSNALYFNGQATKALKLSEEGLQLVNDNDHKLVFLEKSAFYSLAAKQFIKANKYYENIFSNYKTKLSHTNKIKAYLSWGFTLFKLGKLDLAKKRLNLAVSLSQKPLADPVDKTKKSTFKPELTRIIAYGLLAKIEKSPHNSIKKLRLRIEELNKIKDNYSHFTSNEAILRSQLVVAYNQIAEKYESINDYIEMRRSIWKAVEISQEGNILEPQSYRSIINFLSLAISHNSYFKSHKVEIFEKIIGEIQSKFSKIKKIKGPKIFQKLKLSLFWITYQKHVLNRDINLEGNFVELFSNPELTTLLKHFPQNHKKIVTLRDNLLNYK